MSKLTERCHWWQFWRPRRRKTYIYWWPMQEGRTKNTPDSQRGDHGG